MAKFIIFIFIIIAYNSSLIAMDKKPYHHLPDGTFRNPEGSPVRTSQAKFSYTQFIKLKKKIDMTVPKEHVVAKEKVLSNLEKYKNEDYIAWIGHATYLIKLGDTTIITDPVFSKNAGPLIFGPDRFTEPALNLDEIPKTDLLLLTHNHYDHQDMGTIRRYPFKDTKVLTPLNLGKYFTKNKFKPELICIEIHEKEIELSEIYKFLVHKKYELIWSGIFSHIFKRFNYKEAK